MNPNQTVNVFIYFADLDHDIHLCDVDLRDAVETSDGGIGVPGGTSTYVTDVVRADVTIIVTG